MWLELSMCLRGQINGLNPQISNTTHNTKGVIGFVEKVPKKISYLCTYGSSGHSRGACIIVITYMKKNFKTASNRKTNHVKRKESHQRNRLVQKKKSKHILPIWINRDLLHPFY